MRAWCDYECVIVDHNDEAEDDNEKVSQGGTTRIKAVDSPLEHTNEILCEVWIPIPHSPCNIARTMMQMIGTSTKWKASYLQCFTGNHYQLKENIMNNKEQK
ncbi:hypothetical protein ACJX0J_007041, partial [Zea mays]